MTNIPEQCPLLRAVELRKASLIRVSDIPNTAHKYNGLMFPQRIEPTDVAFASVQKAQHAVELGHPDEQMEVMDQLFESDHCWDCTISCGRGCTNTVAQGEDGTLYVLPLITALHLSRPFRATEE